MLLLLQASFGRRRFRGTEPGPGPFVTPVDELIIRHLQGQATPAEEARLAEWRQTSAENESRYAELERIWRVTAHARSRHPDVDVPSSVEILSAGGGSGLDRSGRVGRSSTWYSLRIAAAAAVVVLVFALSRLIGDRPADEGFGATEFVTGSGELVTARLDDGSVVRLGPNTRLRVSGRGSTREAWLDGRAFFAVASDRRPFRVRTRAGEAVVLGTRFEVQVDSDSLRVLVVEGGVAVSAAGERVEIGAGEISRVQPGAGPTVEVVDDVHAQLKWMGNLLVFESTPLRDVALEIEQRYGMQVRVHDSALAERTVTALFSEQSAEEVLAIICRIADAYCSVTDGIANIEP